MGFHSIALSLFIMLALVSAACAPATLPPPAAQAATPAARGASPESATPAAPAPSAKPSAEQPQYGGVLLGMSNTNPPSSDIHQESTLAVIASFGPAYNSLVKYDPFKIGEIIGDLAQRWEVSADSKAYTFHLAKDAKWHDGQPFSAEDVKYSLDRIRKPPRGTVSQRQTALSTIKDIEVMDKDTVKVILDMPHAAFLSMLSTGWEVMMPKHIIEAKGNMKKDVIGTGPFRFISHDSGVVTELKRNPNYFVKDRPYLDGIRMFVITDPTTKFAALRTKRLHITGQTNGLTASQAELIEKEKLPIKIMRSEAATNWELLMRHDVPPWDDLRVRKAVSLALDRPEAIKIVSEGLGSIGGALPGINPMAIPDAELKKMPGYRQPKEEDITEAKRLLADASYPKGFETRVLFRSGAIWEKGAVFYKDQLAKIGINAILEGKESGTYLNLLYEGRFVIAIAKGATFGAEPELMLGQEYVTGAGRNYSKFSDKEFDRMFEEQRQISDTSKRKELILKMQQRLLDTVPFAMSHWETYFMGQWPEVHNYLTLTDAYGNNKWQEVWLSK